MKPPFPLPLPRDAYRAPAAEVAPRLLGCRLCRVLDGELLVGRIVETEAYLPSGDLAAHQRRPRSAATASLFGEEGRAYVHRMRQHSLLDVVTRPAGIPPGRPGGAVLIRACQPLAGVAAMAARRRTEDQRLLAAGPGRLCQAMAIDLSFDGRDLASPGELFIAGPDQDAGFEIVACPRIGITGSAELALRFVIAGSAFLSAPPPRR